MGKIKRIYGWHESKKLLTFRLSGNSQKKKTFFKHFKITITIIWTKK
uniref:Uncharacterized protein n=1 Tax=Anguilla anguilla TaxID=7936 RepID=A0A0E9PQY7_ANGAN